MSLLVGNTTISDGYRNTYNSSSAAISTGTIATPTDVFFITGSATKTIRILRIGFSGTATAVGMREIMLVKRSSANTGGAAAGIFPRSPYLATPPPTATATTQTNLALTTGSLVGIIRSTKINFPTTTAAGAAQNEYIWTFNRSSQALYLRGTGEVIAVNFNSVAMAGGTITIWAEWTEE